MIHPSIRLVPSPSPVAPPDLRAPAPVEPDAGLLHAEAASDRTWWLGGRRVHAHFQGLRGLIGAQFGLRARLTGLAWGHSASAATWISPRAVRLERASPAGSFLETIWVPERLPGLLVELRPVGRWVHGRTVCGTLRLDFADAGPEDGAAPEHGVGPEDESVREGNDLRVAVSGDATARWCGLDRSDGLLIAAFDRDGAVDVLGEPRVENGSLAIDVAWTPSADSPLALAILAGEPSPASLRSLLVAEAHARRALPGEDALRTHVGLDEVDEAIAWAWTRMRDRVVDDVGPIPAIAPGDVAPWVRTALAVGLRDAARAVLPEDPRTLPGADAWEAWASGVGDDALIDDLERRVGDARDHPPNVRRRIADVADRAGRDTWAAALRIDAGDGERGASPGAREGRAVVLPSIGSGGGSGSGSGSGSGISGPDASGADGGGPEAWRAGIASDPVALAPDGWRILEGLVSDVLGWLPDAATGRMHLTPRLPTNWTRFGVRGLRGGELRMRLEWRRIGASEVWTFAPMAGAVPATLILRLPVPDETATVTVDDVPAELDPERIEGETRVPIQLQLDRERVVRVGGAPGTGGGGSRVVLPTLSPSSR